SAREEDHAANATVLFAANFPTNTGYAWGTIERVFRRVAEKLASEGVGSAIAYPSLAGGEPTTLLGSGIPVLAADLQGTRTLSGMVRFLALLRRHRVGTLYLTDQ